MKKTYGLLIIFIVLISACHSKKENSKPLKHQSYNFTRDLDEIKKEGKLKALITYSASTYFLYRGQPMGYEYELLKRFADNLGVELELKISKNLNSLLDELNKGNVDIIAHGLAITSERKKTVTFTDYLYLTQQVLVQKKPDNWRNMSWSNIQKSIIKDPIELIGDTISIRKNSSYFERLNNLSKEIGGKIIIDTLNGNLSTDEIIKMVVDGKVKYTVAYDNLASINASYYPILDTDVSLSFSQRIGWAVRPNSKQLLNAANSWIENEKKNTDYYVIYNKYFKNKRGFKKRISSDFYSLNKNQISKYDAIIKENAEKNNWDWRLLASLIYQESRFNPQGESWVGAGGLMQIMPATARELGVKDVFNAKQNINAGVTYLNQLYNNFDEIKDRNQRIKFAMASYNCGYYHVLDAQKLAELKGLNKNIWDNNVDKMILALSYPKNYNNEAIKYGYVRGIEPFKYIEQIFERYEHYKKIIDK